MVCPTVPRPGTGTMGQKEWMTFRPLPKGLKSTEGVFGHRRTPWTRLATAKCPTTPNFSKGDRDRTILPITTARLFGGYAARARHRERRPCLRLQADRLPRAGHVG